jgi:hypothetical protein
LFAAITSPRMGVVHGVRARDGIVEVRGFLAYRKFGGLSLCVKNTTMPAELAASCRKFAERSGIAGAFRYAIF